LQERAVEMQWEVVCRFTGPRLIRGVVETPISKGEGQYHTTVGYIDVRLEFGFTYSAESVGPASGKCPDCDEAFSDPGPGGHPAEHHWPGWSANIEVKIGRVPVSDAIRPVVFYREYTNPAGSDHGGHWMLATPWSFP
jgi:hypothetical protein